MKIEKNKIITFTGRQVDSFNSLTDGQFISETKPYQYLFVSR